MGCALQKDTQTQAWLTGLLCNSFSKHRGETIGSRYKHTIDRHRRRSRAPHISEVLPHGYFSKKRYSSEEQQKKFEVSKKTGFILIMNSYPGQKPPNLKLTSVIYYCEPVRPLTWPWQTSWLTTDLFHAVGGTCECPWGSPGFLSVFVDPNLSVYWRSGCSLTASLSSTVYPHVQSGQRGGAAGCQSEPLCKNTHSCQITRQSQPWKIWRSGRHVWIIQSPPQALSRDLH